MQWTTVHIYLAAYHSHEGSGIALHSHHIVNHHADTIDPSHQSGNHDVVELDWQYNVANEKRLEERPMALILTASPSVLFFRAVSVEPSKVASAKHGDLDRSTIRPRAPPQPS